MRGENSLLSFHGRRLQRNADYDLARPAANHAMAFQSVGRLTACAAEAHMCAHRHTTGARHVIDAFQARRARA